MNIKKCVLCGVLLSIQEANNNIIRDGNSEFCVCDMHYQFLKVYAELVRCGKI